VGARRARSLVFDAGALIAFERNDRKVRTLVELAMAHGAALHVPGGVVAQVWRDGSRQARLARLLGSGILQVQSLDRAEAQATGALCGKAGVSDVVDASVVLLARRQHATVVTSDPEDLARIDAKLTLVAC
jgi:hypothetical protein